MSSNATQQLNDLDELSQKLMMAIEENPNPSKLKVRFNGNVGGK
jgi:hypothetical protein